MILSALMMLLHPLVVTPLFQDQWEVLKQLGDLLDHPKVIPLPSSSLPLQALPLLLATSSSKLSYIV
ncbi:hypothetical protein NC651_021116 [Populus alba x Populus x berolinensis]|nr:hypothetical protein NC651_021116 [Populus alba x Populus x berolinensis]